ncbi:MAG: pyridoxamine 5'-phosphate oxidase [Firmicutes bacterium]|nr:pyridoxamine 5'-phosphate oxidase [Bacillota bacterium]
MKKIEKISNFLTEAGVFFLATTDGDQPKCRPLGVHVLRNDQLYFGVGDFKDVYKQLRRNPKTEIVAVKGDDWLRLYGEAVFEQDNTIAQEILEKIPFLKEIYNEETGYKLAIFHLEKATAEFRSLMTITESYEL